MFVVPNFGAACKLTPSELDATRSPPPGADVTATPGAPAGFSISCPDER